MGEQKELAMLHRCGPARHLEVGFALSPDLPRGVRAVDYARSIWPHKYDSIANGVGLIPPAVRIRRARLPPGRLLTL